MQISRRRVNSVTARITSLTLCLPKPRRLETMSKQVISFRLSEADLQALDLACQRFGENRSQVVNRAIRSLLEEYVDDGKTVTRRPYWLTSLEEGR